MNTSQNITLKIQVSGNSYIFSPNFESKNYPNTIKINGVQSDTINNIYNFNGINNIIDLIWNYSIDDCSNMFNGCSNINEIIFSNFDTSKVSNMKAIVQV